MNSSPSSTLPTFSSAKSTASSRGAFAKTLAFLPPLLVAGSLGAHAAEPAATPSPEGKTSEGDAVVALPELTVGASEQPKVSNPKFTAPLLDTPQTVVVINRDVFEQQGATTLRDVLRNTPGITFQAGEGGTANGDQMTIRGFDARTDIYVDGIRDTGTYTRDAFNMEQVEVVKGPSGSSTGRGSTGASINLVSKTPKLDSHRGASFGVGSDDYYRSTIDINQALPDSPIAGTAFRINGLWQDSGVAGRDEVENKTWAIAPSLSFGLGTATRATISYLHLEQDNIPDYGIPYVPTGFTDPSVGTPGGIPNVDQSNWYGLLSRDYEKVISDVATVGIERDLTPDTTLRNTTRFSRVDRDSVITAPRFVDTTGVTTTDIRRSDEKSRDEVSNILANNLNLTKSLETGFITHSLSLGVEVSRETVHAHGRSPTVSPDPANPTSVFNPNPHDPNLAPLAHDGSFSDSTADSLGLYLFDTLELSEQWQLNGGLRWDYFSTDYFSSPATGSANPVVDASRIDRMLSWNVGAVFKPRPNGSIFIGYGNSFNPSAEGLSLSDGSGRAPANVDTAPEENRTMEIGTKWDLYNGRLSLSAALFRTEKLNARETDPLATSTTVLSGEQRVQGIELGASGFITRDWNVFAGYVYMDSEITKSNNPLIVGNELIRTPNHSFNLWSTYALPFGLTVGGGAQYMGEVKRNTSNPSLTVDSYLIYSAVIGYEVNDHLNFRLNVNNLTNEEYVDRVGGGHYIPGATRSFVLSANVTF